GPALGRRGQRCEQGLLPARAGQEPAREALTPLPGDPGLHPLRRVRGGPEPVLPAAREVEVSRDLPALPQGRPLVRGGRMGPWMIAACLLFGCGGGVSAPSSDQAALGREFTLAVGQSAVVDATGLRIALQGVGADSRCPVDVHCVWEGDAAVSVEVAGPSSL